MGIKYKIDSTYESSFISQEKLKAVKRIIKNNIISLADYRKKWWQLKKEMSLNEYKREFLKQAGARSFTAFCAIINSPVYEEPLFLEYIKSLDSERQKAVKWQIKKNYAEKNNDLEHANICEKNKKEILTRQNICKKQMFLLVARGLRKTTYFIVNRASFLWISDNVIFKRPPTIAITGESPEKAIDSMKATLGILNKEIIKHLYPEILERDVDRQDKVRFKVKSKYELREAHIGAFGFFADFEAYHFTYMLVDDPETWQNTRTKELREKIKNKYDDLTFLDDHSIYCRIEGVGTAHRDCGLYPYIEDKESTTVVRHPVERYNEDGTITYNFTTWDNRYARKGEIEGLKNVLPKAKFEAQVNQKYMKESGNVRIMSKIPEYHEPYSSKEDYLSNHFWTGILSDPAISTKQGKTGMNVLLVVTIRKDKNIYVVDGNISKGIHRPSEHIGRIIGLVERWGATEVIMEAIAAQEYMAKHLQEELSIQKKNVMVTHHRHYENKEQHYRNFLEPLAHQGKIYVAQGSKVLNELRKQLIGEGTKEDCVDCLSFLKEKNFNYTHILTTNEISFNKKISNKKKRQKRKNVFGRITKW